MSIDQTDVVDAIGTDKESGAVILTITDHLTWDEQHLVKLEAKLASYISFIESGQIVDSYPTAAERDLEIHVVCQYRPPESAQSFLKAAEAEVAARGIRFKYGPIPNNGYKYDHG